MADDHATILSYPEEVSNFANRISPFAVSLLTIAAMSGACGGSDDSATTTTTPDGGGAGNGGDSGGGGAMDGAAEASHVDPNSLVVHAGPDAHVLLGDGSVFNQVPVRVGTNGDSVARFTRITLPQDVTIVRATQESAGSGPTYDVTNVLTIAGVNRNEIWPLENPPGYPSYPDPEAVNASIHGNVLGTITQGTKIMLLGEMGPQITGGPNYGFSVSRSQSASKFYDLVAYDGVEYRAVNVGVLRNVDVTGALTGKDITLDHPFDQTVTVTPENDAASGGAYRARLIFRARGQLLFGTDTSGFPAALKSPTMDAPLDFIERTAEVLSGQFDANDADKIKPTRFFADTILPVPAAASSVTAKMLTPAKVTSPELGTKAAPGSAQAAGLSFLWTSDPAAPASRLRVESTAGAARLRWVVYAAGATGKFAFFALPTSSGAISTTFPAGPHMITLSQTASSKIPAMIDLFAQPAGPAIVQDATDVATTTQWGFVTLQ
jgi:hypothetical protein